MAITHLSSWPLAAWTGSPKSLPWGLSVLHTEGMTRYSHHVALRVSGELDNAVRHLPGHVRRRMQQVLATGERETIDAIEVYEWPIWTKTLRVRLGPDILIWRLPGEDAVGAYMKSKYLTALERHATRSGIQSGTYEFDRGEFKVSGYLPYNSQMRHFLSIHFFNNPYKVEDRYFVLQPKERSRLTIVVQRWPVEANALEQLLYLTEPPEPQWVWR